MIKLWLPIFLCLTSTGYVLSIEEGEICTTPYEEEGLCVALNECDVQMGSYSHYMRINSYVSQLVCGVPSKNNILVCCPKKRMLKFLPTRPECGNSSAAIRIVGGTSVDEGKYPWMVVLGFTYQEEGTDNKEFVWICGGALITKRFVLSAAHCFSNSDSLITMARLGVVNIDQNESEENPVDISIEKAIPHENYISGEVANDIAIIKLAQDVDYSPNIQPICLPLTANTMSPEFEKSELFIAGWGANEFNGAESSQLKEVQIPIFDNAACKKIFQKKANITEKQICAGSLLGGKGTCQGDSGGPLMTYDYVDGGFYAIGISSFGYRCAVRGYPGVYTRISSFTKWIKGVIINNIP